MYTGASYALQMCVERGDEYKATVQTVNDTCKELTCKSGGVFARGSTDMLRSRGRRGFAGGGGGSA